MENAPRANRPTPEQQEVELTEAERVLARLFELTSKAANSTENGG